MGVIFFGFVTVNRCIVIRLVIRGVDTLWTAFEILSSMDAWCRVTFEFFLSFFVFLHLARLFSPRVFLCNVVCSSRPVRAFARGSPAAEAP